MAAGQGWRERWPEILGSWQYRRAGWIVLGAFLLGAACLPLILRLSLNSDFTAMLPQSTQSVRDLDEIQTRYGGQMPMMMTVEATDVDALHRYVRQLAPRIAARSDLKVVAVDWNVGEFEQFVTEHRFLYARLADLREISAALRARLDYERARANPFYIDLDDQPPPDPQETIDRIQRESNEARDEMHRRYPDGFFQHVDRPLILMVVHTRIRGGQTGDTDRLEAGIQREAARIESPPGLAIHFGGNLMEIREETHHLESAMLEGLLLTLALVAAAILVFFLRLRSVPILVLVLVPPVMITFGFAQLTVTYLNASSAFLTSIVIGNGVNSSIIWLARYFEERRAGVELEKALAISHRGTWKGTLTAAMAAAVSYGSLIGTDYRGFRDFGIIGGVGMVLCWIATLLLLPALAVLFERARPLKFKPGAAGRKGIYGVIFAQLALRAPRVVIGLSVLATVVLGGAVAWAIHDGPLEYDYGKMRSVLDPNGGVAYIQQQAHGIREVSETATGGALAVLAPRYEDVSLLRTQLERYRRTHREDLGEVRSIDDLLPSDQEQKIATLHELRDLMLQARPRLTEEQQRLIDEQLPPEHVAPIGPADLPISVARGFTESDGTRGRLLFVEHNVRESVFDGRYMIRWAAAARSVRAPGAHAPPPVAGAAAVFADLLETVWSEAPQAIGVALIATVLMLLLTFRSNRERWLTLGSLLIGVLWMSGALWLVGMHINCLNIISYPIAFGTGVDYAVNVMRRYADEKQQHGDGRAAIRASVEETGGAVILCSLTTLIGYLSLHTSTNQALRSFGTAMAAAEITCLLAAVLALPALIYWLEGRRASKAAAAAPAEAADARPSQV